jgi:hypothetical protein
LHRERPWSSKAVEFSAIAFRRLSFPTSSIRNDCLAGISTALALPMRNARTSTCQTRTLPVATRSASVRVRHIITTGATSMIFLLGYLSARTPPASVNRRMGDEAAIPVRPR